jgi:hypothetical protein
MATRKAKRAPKPAASPVVASETCFTIMPFGGWFDAYYADIYVPAIEEVGLKPHRADDLYRPSAIVHDIWEYTKQSRIVLADLTGKNPNVFYELGLAHALAKPAVLVAQSMDDIPFDLRALRVLLYDKNAPDWGTILKEKIGSALKEVLGAPEEAVLPAFLNVKGTSGAPSVTESEKRFLELKQELDLLRNEVRATYRHGRLSSGVTMGPDEAQQTIERYVARNMPDRLIISRLEREGVPAGWVLDQIQRLRKEAEVRLDLRDSPTSGPEKPAT